MKKKNLLLFILLPACLLACGDNSHRQAPPENNSPVVENLQETIHEQRRWMIALIAGSAAFSIMTLIVECDHRQKKRQRTRQIEWRKEDLQKAIRERYADSRQCMVEDLKRIEELKRKIQQVQSEKNELESVQKEIEGELLELTNKQAEAKLKVQALSEAALKDSQIYKDFYHVAGVPGSKELSEKSKITPKDWEELSVSINKTYNDFTWRLQKLYPKISEQEIRVCMLLKISVNPQYIANLLSRSRQAIDSSREKLYKVTHNQEGTARMWDEFIREF